MERRSCSVSSAVKIRRFNKDELVRDPADQHGIEVNEMKEVMVKITTNQVNEQGEEDIMEFVTEAKLYKRGEAVYLIYEETELSGISGCRTEAQVQAG